MSADGAAKWFRAFLSWLNVPAGLRWLDWASGETCRSGLKLLREWDMVSEPAA